MRWNNAVSKWLNFKFSIFDLLIQSRTVLMTLKVASGSSQCGATVVKSHPPGIIAVSA